MAMDQIMLDLECLDSYAQTAAIVSVGAVYFDLETYQLGETFYLELSLHGMQEQLNKGRTLSLTTMQWWLGQTEEARKVFWSNEHAKVCPTTMLHQFAGFCSKAPRVKVWGNGVDYDNICLRSLYELYNIKCPWGYSQNRCYRTFKNMHGDRAVLQRVGAHHNALSDAETQALHLISMAEAVNTKKKK